MRNPYTHEEIHHERPPGRRWWDYGFAGLMVLGVLYILAYFWPWWPWQPALATSATGVGFVYFFLGGWAFLRSRGHRLERGPGGNWIFGALILPVAVWDLLSPYVLGDFHPVSLLFHTLGGLLAVATAGAETWEALRERRKARVPAA